MVKVLLILPVVSLSLCVTVYGAMSFYLAHEGYTIRKKAPLSMQLAKGPFLHREKRSHVILLSLLSYLLFAKLLKFIRHKLYLRANHHLHAGLSGTDHTGYPG